MQAVSVMLVIASLWLSMRIIKDVRTNSQLTAPAAWMCIILAGTAGLQWGLTRSAVMAGGTAIMLGLVLVRVGIAYLDE